MGFELPNGKTARNIQEQVKFLTQKLRELYGRVNEIEVHIVKVEELPETGVEGTIYLLPASDPKEGNYFEEYIWLDDAWEIIGTTQIDLSQYYTKSEADEKFVNYTTDQTISGVLTFLNGFKMSNVANSWSFNQAPNGYLYLGADVNRFVWGFYIFRPNRDNEISLGDTYYRWKEGFINKIIDANGSYSSENVLNEIKAADIVNNTLTQAQYDLITNGKPTLIKGKFSGYKNMIITYWLEYSNSWRALAIANRAIFSMKLSTDTKVLEPGGNDIVLSGIANLNGKSLPEYPNSPATPQYLTYDTDNNLKWTGGASGTILYKHEITFSGGKSIILVNNVSTSYAASSVDQTLADLINDSIMSRLNISGNHSKIVSAIIDGTGLYFTYGGLQLQQATFNREIVNTSETISTDTVTQL